MCVLLNKAKVLPPNLEINDLGERQEISPRILIVYDEFECGGVTLDIVI